MGAAAIRTGIRVTGVQQAGDGARVTAFDRAADTEIDCDAAVAVGADGVHSAVREDLHPGLGGFNWEGTTMWRGTVEAEPYLDGRTMVLVYGPGGVRFLA